MLHTVVHNDFNLLDVLPVVCLQVVDQLLPIEMHFAVINIHRADFSHVDLHFLPVNIHSRQEGQHAVERKLLQLLVGCDVGHIAFGVVGHGPAGHGDGIQRLPVFLQKDVRQLQGRRGIHLGHV